MELTPEERKVIATAIMVWKDYKQSRATRSKLYAIFCEALEYAKKLGVKKEFLDLLQDFPVLIIRTEAQEEKIRPSKVYWRNDFYTAHKMEPPLSPYPPKLNNPQKGKPQKHKARGKYNKKPKGKKNGG